MAALPPSRPSHLLSRACHRPPLRRCAPAFFHGGPELVELHGAHVQVVQHVPGEGIGVLGCLLYPVNDSVLVDTDGSGRSSYAPPLDDHLQSLHYLLPVRLDAVERGAVVLRERHAALLAPELPEPLPSSR